MVLWASLVTRTCHIVNLSANLASCMLPRVFGRPANTFLQHPRHRPVTAVCLLLPGNLLIRTRGAAINIIFFANLKPAEEATAAPVFVIGGALSKGVLAVRGYWCRPLYIPMNPTKAGLLMMVVELKTGNTCHNCHLTIRTEFPKASHLTPRNYNLPTIS